LDLTGRDTAGGLAQTGVLDAPSYLEPGIFQ